MTPVIDNPIRRGFNPDPSIVRVGDDYYLATSTFEWFPGVRLHHSRDLAHWTTIGHVLETADLLDLAGIPDSGGVWAPSLSHDGELFWVVFSVVRTVDGPAKDMDNFVVSAPTIHGPWSEPVRLSSRGFDASLFHDDGRHWLIGIQWDPRPGAFAFAGITLQEFDASSRSLVGENTIIFRKDALIEGPNLYRRAGYYYLMLAEGGTGWEHGVSMARSESLTGPFRADPQDAVMTSRNHPEARLQKAGHGELVETPAGEWYLVHLASRPVRRSGQRFCVTGRETCIQRVTWSGDGWLRLADDDGQVTDSVVPRDHVASTLADHHGRADIVHDDFAEPELDTRRWSTLRRPATAAWVDVAARPGWLRVSGGQSTASVFSQSMIAQRISENQVTASTLVEARPGRIGERAGLVAWYDRHNHFYAFVSREGGRTWVGLETAIAGDRLVNARCVDVELWQSIHLRFELADGEVQFAASPDGVAWSTVGRGLDAAVISDDFGPQLRFTGAFAGLRVDDHDQTGFSADFESFRLEQTEVQP